MHRSCPDTDTVKDILWSHQASIELLHVFFRVLIMDSTYKTSNYRLPLMEIVGITSTDMIFSVAFAYFEEEREDNFSWCLDSLKCLIFYRLMPSMVVTNKVLALMNDVDKIFLTSRHFLCRWRIRKKTLLVIVRKFLTSKRKLTYSFLVGI